MLSEYQISTIRQIWPVLIFLGFVSVFYWIKTKSFLQSAHGLLILISFFYAVVICEYTKFNPPGYYYWPLYALLLFGFASMIFSFRAWPGKKWLHAIHILTVISSFLVWLIGAMAIAHDWI
jgi:hypothetical protein